MTTASYVDRPIRVWKYRGWCAVCNICRTGVAVDAGSQPTALRLGLRHLEDKHPPCRSCGRRTHGFVCAEQIRREVQHA